MIVAIRSASWGVVMNCRLKISGTGLLIGIAAVFVPSAPIDATEVSAVWPTNGHTYVVVDPPFAVSWPIAQTYAEVNYDGYLATITSAEENDFVFSLASTNPNVWPGGGPHLGGFLGDAGVQWVTEEPFSYTSWEPGEPNGPPSSTMRYNGSSPSQNWRDNSPTMELPGLVVEIEPSSVGVEAPRTTTWGRVKGLYQ